MSGRPYDRYWAKTHGAEDAVSFHLLVYHSLDVAAVGRFLPSAYPHLFTELSRQIGLELSLLKNVFTHLLLMHDMGKFSSAFQALNPVLFRRLFGTDKKVRSYDERHDTLGLLLWRENLHRQIEEYSPELASIVKQFACSAFGHHGLPPKEAANGGGRPFRLQNFFDAKDLEAARQFLTDGFACLSELTSLPKLDKQARKAYRLASWRVAGLCTLADWIGSNRDFFPYRCDPMPPADYWSRIALPAAQCAIAATDLRLARPRPFGGVPALFPFISKPTGLQTYTATVALPEGPSMWIIEDLTGSGKTEAALTLAHRLMAASHADGIYVALPTMATANAMYARMGHAYRRLYCEETTPSLVLAHSARHLSDDFRRSAGIDSQPQDAGNGDESTGTMYCNRWLADSAKKALLAEVGVGTIDQALLSVLQVRHQSLRLVGLQRKILILDEVHAYDAYTGILLQALLAEHARGGGSAIVLSATLPADARRDLVAAFARGSGADSTVMDASAVAGFPLVSGISRAGVVTTEFDTNQTQARHVGVKFVHDYTAAVQTVVDAAANGNCVCWVRNTVADAKRAYRDALAHGVAAGKITLFHSRFAMVDRARIENCVLKSFGNTSGAAERAGCVVIATQVVEQSLDLDFDVMLTDLAPIDLLIQRAGRLLRHRRDAQGNRIEGADRRGKPTLTVFAPPFDEQPTDKWLSGAFSGTNAVYPHTAVLWLTQRILHEKGGWTLPADARLLIEGVYGADAELEIPEGLSACEDSAIGADLAKRGQANLNVIRADRGYTRDFSILWDEEQEIPTRLGEPSQPVALAVVHGQTLEPYARAKAFRWDQSIVHVPRHAWQEQAYQIPPEQVRPAEQLQREHPRLKHTQIVVVPQRSDTWQQESWNTCPEYHPCFGWLGSTTREEA